MKISARFSFWNKTLEKIEATREAMFNKS